MALGSAIRKENFAACKRAEINLTTAEFESVSRELKDEPYTLALKKEVVEAARAKRRAELYPSAGSSKGSKARRTSDGGWAPSSVADSDVQSRVTPPLFEGGESVHGPRLRSQPARYADGGEDDLTARLQQVLRALKKQEISRWFLAPVTEEDAPDYFDIVTEPMDLSTVEQRLKDGKYDTKQAFQKDVQLIFSNCEKYNKPGQLSGVCEAGVKLSKHFTNLMQSVRSDLRPKAKPSPQPSPRASPRASPREPRSAPSGKKAGQGAKKQQAEPKPKFKGFLEDWIDGCRQNGVDYRALVQERLSEPDGLPSERASAPKGRTPGRPSTRQPPEKAEKMAPKPSAAASSPSAERAAPTQSIADQTLTQTEMEELNAALNTVAGLENSEEIMLHFWHVIGKEDASLLDDDGSMDIELFPPDKQREVMKYLRSKGLLSSQAGSVVALEDGGGDMSDEEEEDRPGIDWSRYPLRA
jgi:hypothetical protein